jgi:hypothetical protein
MATQTLRKLARGYADGTLDKDRYRKARTELIQGIVSSKTPLAVIEYPPLVQPALAEELDDTQRKTEVKKPTAEKAKAAAPVAPAAPERSEKPPTESTPEESKQGSNKLLFIGLGIALVAIIVVAVITLSGDSSKQSTAAKSTSASSSSNATKTIAASSKSQSMIRDFLSKKNWSSSSLEYFQQQWSALSEDEKLSSKNSLEIGQLTNAIYKQLLEEQALSGLVDDDSSLNKQRQLVQFANALGIDDSRIKLPEDY